MTTIDSRFIEGVSASLVREYLSRKGLRRTLEKMDEEAPRDPTSISNRQALMKSLHIEKLMKKNKDLPDPLRTMIEVITHYFLQKSGNDTLERPSSSKKMSLLYDDGPSTDQTKPRRRDNSASKPDKGLTGQVKQGDLVLEDTYEGETMAGEGRSGLLTKFDQPWENEMNLGSRQKGGKLRGLSGPISSNLDWLVKEQLDAAICSVQYGDSDRDRRRKPYKSGLTGLNSVKNTLDTEFDSQSKAASDLPSFKPTTYTSTAFLNSNSAAETDDLRVKTPPSDRSNGRSSSRSDSSSNSYTGTSKPADKDVLSIEDVLSANTRKRGTRYNRNREYMREDIEDKKDDRNGSYDVRRSSITNDVPVRTKSRERSPKDYYSASPAKLKPKVITKVGDLEIGDIDDLEDDLEELQVAPRIPAPRPMMPLQKSQPMDVDTATALKKLIFGDAMQSFNLEWSRQGLPFCDFKGLQYGIVQRKGGPCGVLASVQAMVLQELLFGSDKKPSLRSLEPRSREQTDALAKALSNIFWRAGERKRAVVTIPSGRQHFPSSHRCRPDNLIETLSLYEFTRYESLLSFMEQQITMFETEGGSGVVLCLYSAILSRSIKKVVEDMDEPTNKLMGLHNYCTQDMVNLLLTGEAASNVFNDKMQLDGMVLKGIRARSDIGLLSLFEHYGSCQVGTYLKTPRYPIWVVCSESHFSVFFCLKRDLMNDWRAEKNFDLYYYDGLARQEEVIRLSIRTTDDKFRAPDGDLVPPLEHCIRTKWGDAEIDWNGTEPLL